MEEIAFCDWPGQPVDLNAGNNPWLPAYGFQTPTALLEKDDFIGNPDAEYFLQNNQNNYMYLETIQEETSDDLRSESDISRDSPVGWLATDSESGSVICIEGPDEIDCESDRELACPAKRRKHENLNLLSLPAFDDEQSLSRSSSLLAFETLEKQCQENFSSSPSIYSQYSFDSLDVSRKNQVSPDSLDHHRDSWEDENDYYKTLQIDVPRKKEKTRSRDSLLYNVSRYSGSESSDSSEGTLEASRSCDNLKTWRSFDSLPLDSSVSSKKAIKEKISAENLSEDSGYSDHFIKSSSASNIQHVEEIVMKTNECFSYKTHTKKNSYVGFGAYDGDAFHHINGNFGVSYQDLSIFEKYESVEEARSPLIERFMKNKRRQSVTTTKIVNIDTDGHSKYTQASASEPNLLQALSVSSDHTAASSNPLDCVSVPKNLNLISDFGVGTGNANESVAVKNWDLTDITNFSGDFQRDNAIIEFEEEEEMAAKVKREGSYDMAMTNRVDLSDEEGSYCYKKRLPKTPIVEFDKKVLQAISETSIQSILSSNSNLEYQEKYLNDLYSSTPTNYNVAKSTPNLAITQNEIIDRYLNDERRKSNLEINRKNSIIKSSTSTSGMSDEDKTITSLGSHHSKEVHFCPVVSEVNWRDDSVSTATPERESSYSLESTPEREIKLVKPKARLASPARKRLSMSQPDLSDNDSCKREFNDSLKSLRTDYSKSQPDVSKLRRKGSNISQTEDNESFKKEFYGYLKNMRMSFSNDQLEGSKFKRRASSFSHLDLGDNDLYKREFNDYLKNMRMSISYSQPEVNKYRRRGSSFSRTDFGDNDSYKREFNDYLKNMRMSISYSQPEVIKYRRRGSSISETDLSDNDLFEKEFYRYLKNMRLSFSDYQPKVSRFRLKDSITSEVELSNDDVCKKELHDYLKNLRKSICQSQPDINKIRRRGSSISQTDFSDTDLSKREFKEYLKNVRMSISQSQPEFRKIGRSSTRRGSQLIKKDEHGALVKAYIDGDGIQYKHTHLDLGVYSAPPQPAAAPAEEGPVNSDRRSQKPAAAMEAYGAQRKDSANSKSRNKIGGFFSRLASFRFSNRKGKEEQAKLKKKQDVGKGNQVPKMQMPQQRVATKDDYIYIPLKGPPGESTPRVANHNNNMVSSTPKTNSLSAKPPLPKQPPRVVHASVKRDTGAQEQPLREDVEKPRRRRRTIDSGTAIPPMEEPMGLIETDLDTEVTVITSGNNVKTRSLLNLGADPRGGVRTLTAPGDDKARPHKSMEFLLDKQNLKVVEPPENELQKGERVMSEHQLRVQRSLQKLTVPDWYKSSQVPREGFLLKKQAPRESRWTGTGSKTTSLSSLGSNCQSPIILSPTPTSQPFVRWSTSKLNSTASSPCASTRSSFNARTQANGSISPSSARSSFSYRQPYMGWRSQERLTRPRTPAERLANTILTQSNISPISHQQESPEIQTSIKEVTSAIVHYVSALRPEDQKHYDQLDRVSQRSSSVSPRGSQKLCWLESSFVGTKPLDSPQTPITLLESESTTPVPPSSLRLDLQSHNDLSLLTAGDSSARPSPGSTTLEDVLDSLLGLPSTGSGGRAPSPSLQETVSANASPCHLGSFKSPDDQFRRRSEGSEPTSIISYSRRVSLNSSPVLRCRYARCGKTALATSTEAENYKNCHNCSYIYCSRTCRRAHWEKHRKTCLFSRIGSLCRQVIAASKEQKDSLLYLSTMARRGFLSHGPGAVKCFFSCPEVAEKFLSNGLQALGELTYVRWQDLLPSEMGPQLYAELVKMCKNYNPDSKLVLYVSICVVSETPASGAVKWERQLVSRCAKLRLSKDIPIPEKEQENPETLILTCPPINGSEEKIKHLREMSVNNLQIHLRQRGVSLRRQHPEIYKQMTAYCDSLVKFTPVTVYPKDSATGKSFMCIIMLEADHDSLKKIETAGVKVKTIDVLSNPLPDW